MAMAKGTERVTEQDWERMEMAMETGTVMEKPLAPGMGMGMGMARDQKRDNRYTIHRLLHQSTDLLEY